MLLLYGLLIFVSFPVGATELCPGIELESETALSFTDAETKLLCGDPENPAWKNIPETQALSNLRAFLQQRGIFDFKTRKKGRHLVVEVGTPTIVKKISVREAPPEFDLDHFRRIRKEKLTPQLLDSTRDRFLHSLRREGYACPEVRMGAASLTGEVDARFQAGGKSTFGSVTEDKVPRLSPEVLSRYRAFSPGELYDVDDLTITQNRILADGVLESAYFVTRCKKKEKPEILLHSTAGPPRQFSLGFGVDTERIFIARAAWRNARVGEFGSRIDVVGSLSYLEQEFRAQSKWYLSPSRFYLRPRFVVDRLAERYFGRVQGQLQLVPALQWDSGPFNGEFSLGPSLNQVLRETGVGPSSSTYLAFNLESRLTSQTFELYRSSPRTGFEVRLDGNSINSNLISDITAHYLRLTFQTHWNVRGFDPPFLVLSLRGGLGTTLTSETPSSTLLLPDFRHFLGGSADLRGFSRKEIPGASGALSTGFLGLESRFPDLLPWGLQPLVFLDVGATGSAPLSLEAPLFWSPGLGLRLETQIGSFRVTVAHGFWNAPSVSGIPPGHLQAYFAFGEEF